MSLLDRRQRRYVMTQAELLRAIAALVRVKEAGYVPELRDEIAARFREERQREMRVPIGAEIWLGEELRGILRQDKEACEAAAYEYLHPSHSRFAFNVLLEFAASLDKPAQPSSPSPSRPPRPVRRGSWHDCSHGPGSEVADCLRGAAR